MPIQVFGQGAVQTAYVGYKSYVVTANLTLHWPSTYQDNANLVAAYMDVDAAAATNFTITLPTAKQVSVGTNFIFSNIGSAVINVANNGAAVIAALTIGEQWYFILTDNSTDAGTWEVSQFGAVNSAAQAVALAGLGLIKDYASNTLDTNINVLSVVGPTLAPLAASRATLFVWTGGSGNVNLPAPNAAGVGNGWYIAINNEGGGLVNVNAPGGSFIDNVSTKTLAIGQSMTVVGDGANYWTLGFSTPTTFTTTLVNIPVSGNTSFNLTAQQAAFNVITFTNTGGPMTGDLTAFFPLVVSQWIMANSTTGTGNLSISLGTVGTPSGTLIGIPRGETIAVYSDGSSMHAYPTVIQATPVFDGGTAAAPGVTFSADTNTGMFMNPLGNIGLSAGGIAVFSANNGALPTVTLLSNGNTVFTATPTVTQLYANNVLILTANATDVTTTQPIFTPVATVAAPTYSFTGDANTGMYSDTPDTISFSAGGVNVFASTTTDITLPLPVTFSTNRFSPTTTVGDMIYASATGAPATNDRLAISTTNNKGMTTGTAGIPAWNALSLLKILPAAGTSNTAAAFLANNTAIVSGAQATSGTFVDAATPMQITITPSSVNSKILIYGHISAATGGGTNILMRLYRGANVGVGTALNSATGGTTANGIASVASGNSNSATFMYYDAPASVAAVTYGVGFTTDAGATINLNRPTNTAVQGASSQLYVIEIGGT